MKILYILYGLGFARQVSLGGSDKRALEIANRLLKKGHEIHFLTTASACSFLKESLALRFIIINPPWFLRGGINNGLFARVSAYLYLTARGCFLNFKDRYDIVYPTSDFFFDILPAIFYKLRKVSCKMISITHHAIANPITRKGEGLKNLFLFLAQRLSFLLMGFFSDAIFLYATKEGEKIKNILVGLFKINPQRIKTIFCGINLKKISQIHQRDKEFSACFVGGLRPAKGLQDIIPIWKEVCDIEQQHKLLIIGSGLDMYVEYLEREIQRLRLGKNVELIREYLSEEELFELISSAKVLILPSYEEGWGIIILEALALGVPAVVYNLTVFELFNDAVIKVKVGDTVSFAYKIIELLSDSVLYAKTRQRGLEISRQFDWDAAAEEEERILSEVINGS